MGLTIKDIAKMAGVSTTTVSLILNDKGDRFNPKTVQRVMDIVQENKYQPNFFAKNMITKNTKTIGVIVPDIKDFFFNQLFEGIESVFTELGYSVVLYRTSHVKSKEDKAIDFMLSRSVSGIIFATPYLFPEKKYQEFQQLCPTILLDRGILKRDFGNFYVDEYSGTCELINYLIAMGHKKIAFIKENKDYYQLSERSKAFFDTMAQHNLTVSDELVQTTPLSVDGGYIAMKELLKFKNQFTAVFCANDYLAMGAYRALQSQGFNIPNDYSVVGFDDIDFSSYITPTLTTVSQPIYEMGSQVAKHLLNKIKNPDEPLQNCIFDSKLVVRNSVKKFK